MLVFQAGYLQSIGSHTPIGHRVASSIQRVRDPGTQGPKRRKADSTKPTVGASKETGDFEFQEIAEIIGNSCHHTVDGGNPAPIGNYWEL